MSERKLIRRFRAGAPTHPWLTLGPGHDCAALKWDARHALLYKIDQVQEGTHFVLQTAGAKSRAARANRAAPCATPRQVGWKAMAKTCSDIAAAGGWPVAAMVAVNLPRSAAPGLAMELYRGITACCKQFRFALAGGDLATSENGLSVTVALTGTAPLGAVWTRGGAQPGDVLCVTGPLGGSLRGKHLRFLPRLKAARALRELAGDGVRACIDITDGLSRDLHHLCAESGTGALLFAGEIPLTAAAQAAAREGPPFALEHALSDGEDFELLVALKPSVAERVLERWPRSGVDGAQLHCIGVLTAAREGLRIELPNGRSARLDDTGYEHTVRGGRKKTGGRARR